MKLSELVTEDRILPRLAAVSKAGVLEEMVGLLCSSGALAGKDASDVEQALMRRETLGTTGIGKGIALPHAKHAGVKGTIAALGRSVGGVDFDALDGQPVHLVFLLVSAPDAAGAYLEALRRVTDVIRDDDLCSFMRRAEDGDELMELLREADERLGS